MNDRLTVFGTPLQRPRAMNPPPVPGSGPSPLLAVGVVLTLVVAALMVYQPAPDGPTGLTTVQSDFLQGLVEDQGRSSPQLQAYDSCSALEGDLKEHLKDEMRATLASNQGGYYRGGWGGGWMEGDVAIAENMAMDDGAVATPGNADPSTGAAQGATDGGGAAEGERDFSGTNNQEGGVDEADFVKTDGDYLYVLFGDQYYYYSPYYGHLDGGRLHILSVPKVGEVEYLSNATVEGWPREMLLSGDRMAVYSDLSVWDLMYAEEEHPLLPYLLRDSADGGGAQNSAPEPSGFVADGASYSYDSFRVNSLSKLTIFGLGDRTAPQVERELYMEGWYQTAREVEGTVRMVSQGYLDIPGIVYWPVLPDEYWDIYWEDENGIWDNEAQQKLAEQLWMEAINATITQNEAIIDATDLNELIPRVYELQGDNVTVHSFTDAADCQDFVIAEDGTASSVTSIMTLDLNDSELSFEADHVMSNWATIYASANMLVIAEMSNDWWWFWDDEVADYQEATNLHAFDISQAGETSYIGSGRVNGTILDQFSLSEHNGFLRVATTTGQWGRWWLPAEEQSGPENHVFVLEQVIHAAGSTEQSTELNVVGHIGGIAVGERIWSSRFVGDRGYLVTFRNVDPLWTLDLSDPANPQVIGELEVPGVSTYIHPLDEDHLLTIGIAGDENGLDWGSTQLSLFDVTDFADPKLASKLELSPVPDDEKHGWNWAWSEATYEHKAFQYWNGQLAIPLSTSRYTWDANGYGHYEYVSKLVLVDVSTEDGLSIYDGTSIDHSMFYNGNDEWYWDRPDIRRTVFIDDYVYAISQQGVTVHKLDTMALTDYAGLPVSDPDPRHYYQDSEEKPGEEREDESDPNDPDDEESDENGTTSSDNSG
uniref:Secreted protein n=1 Tax=uncultured marine group II/III euryarchaeote KM3_75_F08 TaxID=1456505 RepID=A0A075HRJ1_9EURY|nr:Secreted protein [uncultured marine group II/III euryarchaeote KM3_75_F08]